MITQKKIVDVVRERICNMMYCDIEDLDIDQTRFIMDIRKKQRYVKILSIAEANIVSTSPELYASVMASLTGKSRDELFESEWIYGQTIHYIPRVAQMIKLPYRDGFEYQLIEGNQINSMREICGFPNSLAFDANGRTPTNIVLCAKMKDEIVAIAGASIVNNDLMEVGVDVLRQYRGHGLATLLVRNLSIEILNHGKVPFYSASVTNLTSQAVAARSGYMPCWTDSYGTR